MIKLANVQKLFGEHVFQGRLGHTDKCYNGTVPQCSSDNPPYLFWQWAGGPSDGLLRIGTTVPRAHFKARGEETFQVLITVSDVRREANGYFRFTASGEKGEGRLTNNVAPHFKSGAIYVSVIGYGGQPRALYCAGLSRESEHRRTDLRSVPGEASLAL